MTTRVGKANKTKGLNRGTKKPWSTPTMTRLGIKETKSGPYQYDRELQIFFIPITHS